MQDLTVKAQDEDNAAQEEAFNMQSDDDEKDDESGDSDATVDGQSDGGNHQTQQQVSKTIQNSNSITFFLTFKSINNAS